MSLNSTSLAQVKEGALHFIEGSRHKFEGKLDALPEGSFERFYNISATLFYTANFSVCLIQLPVLRNCISLRNSISSLCGELSIRARQAFEAYDANRMHDRCMARLGHDSFVAANPAVNTAYTFVADVQLVDEIWAKWESAALFEIGSGNLNMYYHINNNWPLIHDNLLFARTLAMYHVTWDVTDTQTELITRCAGNYTIEKDGREVFFLAPKTAQCLAKSLLAARLPHLVEEAEVATFLPTAEAQFVDLVFQVFGTGAPLSLVCSLIARHLRDKRQASMYAKAELIGNLNPLKQTLAQMALAVAGCLADDDQDE
jgi:hypothetical protein